MTIFHIVTPEEWAGFHGTEYEAESLGSEGFIHCCFGDQVGDVVARYFSGHERVVILEIDVSLLTSRLVVEPSTEGEAYPHIYGSINVDAIVGQAVR
jgi:uncharacterized protein (DUF952 family)